MLLLWLQHELAQAQRAGTLHRNFQGYSTHAGCDLIGLGVSAISDLGAAYAQNAKDLERYAERIESGQLPVVHGVKLTAEDLLRRDVIQSVMCEGRIDMTALEAHHHVSFAKHFASELARLEPLIEDDLVAVSDRGVQVSPRGTGFASLLRLLSTSPQCHAGGAMRCWQNSDGPRNFHGC